MSGAWRSGGRGRGGVSRWRLLIAAAVVALAAAPAHAVQHLVRPGEPWSELAERVQPGDEIILMPGRHRPASLDDLRGTRQRPITIRGLHPQHPAIIDADREGIRLRRPHYVIIRDLAITGAAAHGISITDERDVRAGGEARERWAAHVTIRNITIEKTGPRGRRNGIRLLGVEHVTIERVRIEGWGGSAIEIVACANVTVEQTIMRGREDHDQISGVHIRAGSENIRVSRSLIADAGESAVVLGGASSADEFRASRRGPPTEGAMEAREVRIERNLMRGGDSAIAFLSAEQCTVRNNAIINPKRLIYFIGPAPGRARASNQPVEVVRQSSFNLNLVVWQPGELEALAYLEPPAKADGLSIEQNLWWSPEDAEARARLGQPIGTIKFQQVMDVDPDLDEQFRPRTRRARLFGPDGP